MGLLTGVGLVPLLELDQGPRGLGSLELTRAPPLIIDALRDDRSLSGEEVSVMSEFSLALIWLACAACSMINRLRESSLH